MDTPRISFLIPSYNHGRYIRNTLDSIRVDAGTLDYEILLIDDGSSDETRATIASWQTQYPDAPLHATFRENRGVSVTLNELVALARGGIIRLCASDDTIVAGSSAKLLAAFASSRAQVIAGDAWVIDDDGKVIGDSAIRTNGGDPLKMQSGEGLKREIVVNWSIPGPCFAIRREVYDVVGPYAEDLPIEDWDFFLRVAAMCEIIFLNEQVSCYRIHGANASRTLDVKRRIRNLNAQLSAGRRRAPLFTGRLRAALERECALLELKIAYLSRTFLAVGVAGLKFARRLFA